MPVGLGLGGVFQIALYNRLGIQMGSSEVYTTDHPAMSWQGFGGLVVMVGWGLWVARAHLAAVWRKARWNDPEADDREEMPPYRVALWWRPVTRPGWWTGRGWGGRRFCGGSGVRR